MAVINFNAGKSEVGQWVPFPEGTYDIRILDAEVTSSKSGNQQLQLSCEVVDGPRAGDATKIWYSLLPQSGWKLKRLLDALMVPYDANEENDDLLDITFDTDELINRVVAYEVTQETYNGKVTNRFQNEALSSLDPYANESKAAPQTGTQARPAPAPAAQAAPQTGTAQRPPAVARRPRPGN